jgi:6-pyruvoyltetrahydropterin/6-carboxytetrahydropterin synthase
VVGQRLFLLDSNPTAENLADYLLREVAPEALAGTGVQVVKVVLWESESSFAEARL